MWTSLIAAIFLFFCQPAAVPGLDPLSVAVGAGVAISGYLLKSRLGDMDLFESCADKWIPSNIHELRTNLRRDVFGQELATNSVVDALDEHYGPNRRPERRFKPLVISLHGPTGTGKNAVTDHIVASLFRKGADSGYAHFYSPNYHFWDPAHVGTSKKILEDYILRGIQECQRSVFVFDEADKFPDGLLSVLEQFASARRDINGINYNKVVFILISNTAQLEILERTDSLVASGRPRDKFTLGDFEDVIKRSVKKMRGGLYGTELVESGAVDVYVPFLPLERSHVEQCARVLINAIGQIESDQLISNIIDRTIFSKGYSVSGCKRLLPIVLSQIYVQRLKTENLYYSD